MNASDDKKWVVLVNGQRLVDFAPTTRELAEAEASRKRASLQEAVADGPRYQVTVSQLLLG